MTYLLLGLGYRKKYDVFSQFYLLMRGLTDTVNQKLKLYMDVAHPR